MYPVIFKLFLIKEFKKSYYFFIGLSLLLFLGLSGLLSISFVSGKIKENLLTNARELLTSDLSVSSRRGFYENERKIIHDFFREREHRSYQLIDIYSMVTHVKSFDSRLVEIRSYEDGFPFYGAIKLTQGEFVSGGFFISQDLSSLWGVTTGDKLKVGTEEFEIQGIVESDSSIGIRGVSLAPRVYLPLNLVQKAGLIREGSTGQFSFHFKLFTSDKGTEEIRLKLLKLLPDPAIKVMTFKESSSQTGRIFDYVTDFMSLSALVGFLLALVGVFYFYQSYLLIRLKDFSLFYLHGLTKLKILYGICLQFSLIFTLSLVIFFIFINPSYFFFKTWLSTVLGLDLPPSLNYSSLIIQLPMLYGLGLSLLVPLLMGLMRTPMGLQLKLSKQSLGHFRFYDFIPFLLGLWGVGCYLAHSVKIGSFFLLSLIIIFFLSFFLIKIFQKTLGIILPTKSLSFLNLNTGIASRSFIRSGHKLIFSFISLVMGISLISLIFQLDFLIKREFSLDENKPSLFLFDIQEEQLEDLKLLASKLGLQVTSVTPLIRGRIDKVNGVKFGRQIDNTLDQSREEEFEARTKNRGINLTYRKGLSSSEKIVEGLPFPEQHENQEFAYLSLEEKFAKRMKINLGDQIVLDVQGIEIQGIVRNLREVKWTSFHPNFFVNVQPGFIDEAPKTYLAVLPKMYSAHKFDFQKASIKEFPNISFIDMDQLVKKISILFEKSRQAVELISWLSLAIGFVILYGLCHDQVFRRSYELSLLKTLGFGFRSLLSQLLIEFGFIFLFATGLGLFLGWLLATIIGLEVFKILLSFDFSHYLILIWMLIFLCFATIFIVSWKTLKRSPRELLSDM